MTSPSEQRSSRRRLKLFGAIASLLVLGLLLYSVLSPERDDDLRAGLTGEEAFYASFAGSQSCIECHREAFEDWRHSHHGLAERPFDPELDHEAFDPPHQFEHGTQTSEAYVGEDGYRLRTLGEGDELRSYVLDRVIGVSPLRQFLVPAEGGRLQTTEVAWDPHHKEWFNIFEDEDRFPGEWGHWTGRGMTWNTMCAACHNTGLRKNYDAEADIFRTRMAEMSVSCESCHGPRADHVSWYRNPRGERPAFTQTRMTREQILATCGSCHSRRSELTGDFLPGDDFLDHYAPVIPDDTDLYYPDGQVREENYEYISFLSSRMHTAGVSCLDCHHPHTAKTRFAGNQLCMQCHDGSDVRSPRIDPAAHSFHEPGRPGGNCVDCHMPVTVYMARHPRRDHSFGIPDPLLTRDFGVPNACNNCHQDRDPEWAAQAMQAWYGERLDRPSRVRAHLIARAREGDRQAVEDLQLTAADDTELWRAVATTFLRHWTFDPVLARTLMERARDPDPLVRATAARGLEPLVAQNNAAARATARRLLDDPVRAVRVEAAWALRSTLDSSTTAGQDLEAYLTFNLDQPTGALRMGVYQLDRRQGERALTHFRRAVRLDPRSAGVRHEYAVALSMLGRSAEAVRELETACELAPEEAGLRLQLALARNEAGDLPGTVTALEEAVRLDPLLGRAWYNLGLAYSSLNQLDRSVWAFEQGEIAEPGSPQLPYARATVLARAGRVDEARAAAARALQINPGFTEAVRLLQALEQRQPGPGR